MYNEYFIYSFSFKGYAVFISLQYHLIVSDFSHFKTSHAGPLMDYFTINDGFITVLKSSDAGQLEPAVINIASVIENIFTPSTN